jgi:ATP-dependent helicase Lhr and Lhr-like helicase
VVREGERYFATEATRDPKAVLRGRLEALGPVFDDDPWLLALEADGVVLRTRIDGRVAWCDRRLLARIHRYTLDRLRREIEPVSAAQFLRFLAAWQHADPAFRLEGPRGVAGVLAQLAGFEVPAAAWEASVLPARVRGYRREWLDQLTLSGEVAWARLWGAGTSPVRRIPLSLLPREDLDAWASLAAGLVRPEPFGDGRAVLDALERHGASFFQDLARTARLLPAALEATLGELIGQGWVTCDSFAGLRSLLVPSWRRRASGPIVGRWSVLRREAPAAGAEAGEATAEFVARRLLQRTGVVFRKTLARERQPLFWRDVARACRRLEARGEIRGGRFVAGFDGEQYALPEAVRLLRELRQKGERALGSGDLSVTAADPLNFQGILTPDDRVASSSRRLVRVG